VGSSRFSIAIIGADGQLGMDLQRSLSAHRVAALTYRDLDILDPAQTAEKIASAKPDWVINAAALTNVDWCEANDVKAFQVNALGARHVARATPAAARILQVSTDYVFDGRKKAPYEEEDTPGPLNVYGITKLAGEHYVRSAHEGHYIIRTSGLYGTHPSWGKKRNFADAILALADGKDEIRVVGDEILTPTFTEDLAEQIRVLVASGAPPGIYHATNGGECSWHEFASAVLEISGKRREIEKTTAAEWNAPARRPAYSVLRNAALERLGLDVMPFWKDALGRYLSKKVR
jgi:dTDP-4-dehydrorhamnose reductase